MEGVDEGTAFVRRAAEGVQQFARWLLQRPTVGAPGAKFLYSNAGYVVAAAMVERVTEMPWKDAVRKWLFVPLEMNANFGWPAADNPNEPFGHLGTC
jgi:D-alanyl-D-alanine carboxypeptidase